MGRHFEMEVEMNVQSQMARRQSSVCVSLFQHKNETSKTNLEFCHEVDQSHSAICSVAFQHHAKSAPIA